MFPWLHYSFVNPFILELHTSSWWSGRWEWKALLTHISYSQFVYCSQYASTKASSLRSKMLCSSQLKKHFQIGPSTSNCQYRLWLLVLPSNWQSRCCASWLDSLVQISKLDMLSFNNCWRCTFQYLLELLTRPQRLLGIWLEKTMSNLLGITSKWFQH